MPSIIILGLGTTSIQKADEIRNKIKQTVAEVRMLEITPEEVSVHTPTDLSASVDPLQWEITIMVTNLYRTRKRTKAVLSLLRTKLVRAAFTLFPSANHIVCGKPDMCFASEVTTHKRRR